MNTHTCIKYIDIKQMMQITPLSVLISNNVEMLLSGDVGSFQLHTF